MIMKSLVNSLLNSSLRSADYVQLSLACHYFLNSILLKHNDAHTVMYCLWLFSCFNFRVEQVVIKTMWPTKSKILSGFLQKIFVHLDID